jgi:outer membrane receptor for ferrienterochelin and colicins
MKRLVFFILVAGFACCARAQEAEPAPDSAKLHTIEVHSSTPDLLKRHEIQKTEVVTQEAIEHKRAQTLADAVSNQVGIDTQNSCANCGSKRITINGLRGEHTTILIDGVPMHSSISSFYGMDAVPVVGIESIEVSRGAGASLIAPEAIGGVVNIITAKPKATGLTLNGNWGNAATGLVSLLGSVVGGEGKHRLVFAGQLSNQGHWDIDGNQVSEAPELNNQSFFIKASSDFTEQDKIEARYARQTVGILGGTVDGTRPGTYVTNPTGTPPPFIDNDVSKQYTGAQNLVTDVVNLARHEAMVRWSHFFNSDTQLQITSSAAEQKQNSLYMHGYDYRNRDWLVFGDARLLFALGENHFFTIGTELKNQDMASESDKLYVADGLANDSFNYRSHASFLQWIWAASPKVELSVASRLDRLQVNWLAQTTKEYEIDTLVAAPRLHLKVDHTPQLTSRLMYGRGYRPPLSFFESQHGLNEYGFSVAITDIESSHSVGYSLAYNRPGFSLAGSSHYTWLSNMAYADGDISAGTPAVFRNTNAEYRIWANDVMVSYDVAPYWNLQLSYELFTLPEEYKIRLPAAAVEQRARLVSDMHFGNWEVVNTFTWVAARNLKSYGYDGHYLTLGDVPDDPAFPGLGSHTEVITPKNAWAPAFLTWDLYVGYNWRNNCSFFASVQNVLNFTQTGQGDSPLNWSTHGGDLSHFHLDNNHTWGPLRGRVVSVGMKVEL